jgi:hypothetical protein
MAGVIQFALGGTAELQMRSGGNRRRTQGSSGLFRSVTLNLIAVRQESCRICEKQRIEPSEKPAAKLPSYAVDSFHAPIATIARSLSPNVVAMSVVYFAG